MNPYKSVNELTAEQFAELREKMVVDVEVTIGEAPASWYDANGDFTDEAVKKFYEHISFVDEDFVCTMAA